MNSHLPAFSPALLDEMRCEKCRHRRTPRVKFVEPFDRGPERDDYLAVSCSRCGWTVHMQPAAKGE